MTGHSLNLWGSQFKNQNGELNEYRMTISNNKTDPGSRGKSKDNVREKSHVYVFSTYTQRVCVYESFLKMQAIPTRSHTFMLSSCLKSFGHTSPFVY